MVYMTHKNKLGLWIGVAVLGFIVTIFIERINNYKLDDLQQFLGLFSVISFIFLVSLLFLSDQVSITWFKFARVYIPLTAVLVAVVPSESGLMDIGFFGYDKENLTWIASTFYILISLVLIIRKAVQLRRVKTTAPSSGGHS